MLTTVSFLHFDQHKGPAFAAMGLLPPKLKKVTGLQFVKLMGSGRGPAFSIRPHWGRYCLLAVWDGEEVANAFFAANPDWNNYAGKANSRLHFRLQPLSAKGTWNKLQPFEHNNVRLAPHTPIAVLTRASLQWTRLPSFWAHARRSTAEMPGEKDGLLFSAGIGEVPFVEQATFSVWQSVEQMMAFVTAPAHKEAVKLRHQEQWYKEELFARFQVLSVETETPANFPALQPLMQPVAR